MLIPQLHGKPFGPRLIEELKKAEQVDIATAWIRASGVRQIADELTAFLKRGGKLRVVVGVDCENTSAEGLDELIEATEAGKKRVFLAVRHNEASSVFHPKVYAFRTEDECRVYVGSSNLTESGLYLNEEASGLLVEPRAGKLETSVDGLFDSLLDKSDNLVLPLTKNLVKKLLKEGYVGAEASLPGKSSNRARRFRPKKQRLFGSRHPKRPPRKKGPAAAPPIEPPKDSPAGDWSTVYLRLRLARGTQAQIPIRVVREVRRRLGLTDIDGALEVTLRSGGGKQKISPTYSGSPDHPNTYKFEALETAGHPLLRMDIVGGQVIVEKLDSDDPAGRIIDKFLVDGLTLDPPATIATTRDLDHATLYRFV